MTNAATDHTRRLLILVVDDDASLLDLLAQVLEEAGYQTVQAQQGEEALRRLAEGPVDLVLSDVMMPVIDGRELARRMAAAEAYRGIPVVLVTAGGRQVVEASSPAVAVLSKPFDLDQLLATVTQTLRDARGA
jgi:CheY-like chemotaxis protein